MIETKGEVTKTVTNVLSCVESYTDLIQLGLCLAGNIGGIIQSTTVIVSGAECEHYVFSGC